MRKYVRYAPIQQLCLLDLSHNCSSSNKNSHILVQRQSKSDPGRFNAKLAHLTFIFTILEFLCHLRGINTEKERIRGQNRDAKRENAELRIMPRLAWSRPTNYEQSSLKWHEHRGEIDRSDHFPFREKNNCRPTTLLTNGVIKETETCEHFHHCS